MTIAELFYPLSAARFLVQHYNTAPVHAPGDSNRFALVDAGLIARQVERELEAEVSATMPQASVELQRGERDVIGLQLSGEVRWSVYGNGKEAAPETTFTAVAKSGSAVYIPRGFWRSCEAQPADARRLEFQICNPTALEFLDWLTGKVKELEVFQSDLPRFAAPAVQAEYLKTLRRSVSGAFRAPGLLEAYARRLNRLARWCGPPGLHDSMIILTAPRIPKIYRHDAETIYLSVAGQDLYFPTDAAPLLQYVIDRAPVAASDFYRQFTGEFDSEELSGFLSALTRGGVIG